MLLSINSILIYFTFPKNYYKFLLIYKYFSFRKIYFFIYKSTKYQNLFLFKKFNNKYDLVHYILKIFNQII